MPHNCGEPQLSLPESNVWAAPLCSLSVNPGGSAKQVKCDPSQLWAEWKVAIRRPQTDWRTARRELIIKLETACSMSRMGPKTRQSALALVDSGARLPLVFRTGLFPTERLQNAQFPVSFTTADGSVMHGGKLGVFLGLCLPVQVGSGESSLIRTYPIFAYEAPLHGVDILIGYPFLKAFDLVIDAVSDCLVHGPLCRRFLQPSTGRPLGSTPGCGAPGHVKPDISTTVDPCCAHSPTEGCTPAAGQVPPPDSCCVQVASPTEDRTSPDGQVPPPEPLVEIPAPVPYTPSPEELRCLLLHDDCAIAGVSCCQRKRLAVLAANPTVASVVPRLPAVATRSRRPWITQ